MVLAEVVNYQAARYVMVEDAVPPFPRIPPDVQTLEESKSLTLVVFEFLRVSVESRDLDCIPI